MTVVHNVAASASTVASSSVRRVEKTDEEWRKELTPQQFDVTRRGGTEQAFTGEYHRSKDKGTYHCVCCGNPLFPSDTKYETGTGWPSFWAPLEPHRIRLVESSAHGVTRTQVQCAACDAHVGHVYPDGPQPTGQRFCLNSAALRLERRQPAPAGGGGEGALKRRSG